MERRPISRVLAATDGSEQGEHAVLLARALTRQAGAELSVLAVKTEELASAAGDSRRRVASWTAGVPAIEIVHRAEAMHADLLVLGRRNRTPDHPRRLGPTSDAVIRRRSGPSLLVPRTVQGIGRILIAIDGTPRCLGVLESAAAFVAATLADCSAVLVLPAVAPAHPDDPFWEDPRVVEAKEALDRYPGLTGRELTLRSGAPVGEILSVLRQTGADVLVLGVRRGGPAGDMGSGHVGRDLLQMAPGAILTIPI